MKKFVFFTVPLFVAAVIAHPASAEESSLKNLVISEFQVAGLNDPKQEFVEIYNPNDQDMDITGVKLQYRSAGTVPDVRAWSSSNTMATVACPSAEEMPNCTAVYIKAHGRISFSRLVTIDNAINMVGGFSDKAGQIRIVRPNAETTPEKLYDFVGYGVAALYEGSLPAIVSPGGLSSRRSFDSSDGSIIDTDDNVKDFVAGCVPTPDSSGLIYKSTETEPPVVIPDPTPVIPPASEPLEYSSLIVSELLPNPAAPQTDDEDEFIEIYNPNDEPVNLKGYALKSGNSQQYKYVFGEQTVGAHAYLSIKSAESGLTLSNSGSRVGVYDPDDTLIGETVVYGAAAEGQAWMLDETGWHWTLSPTPGEANILEVEPPKIVAATAAKTTKAAATTAKKTTAAKAPASTKKVTTAKTAAKKVASTSPPDPKKSAGPNYWIIGGVGLAALGYAGYEYRQDIGRWIMKARKRITRKKD